MTSIVLPAGARILVIALRRLGDVLLATPLVRSLRRAYPDARIDALVFQGTEGMLAGNPDLDATLVLAARPTARQSLGLARRLWRRYDLALSTQSGDRPTFFAWAAARRRVGPVEARGLVAGLKRLALDRTIVASESLHRVTDVLRLAEALGIPAVPEVVCPAGPVRSHPGPAPPYAVIHAAPIFRYKRWTIAGWREIAAALARRDLRLVATGGPAAEERRYLDQVWDGSGCDIRRLDGTLGWPDLALLIAAARIYIGPDTSVTHLAAATGCPTVALYGPTDPRRWGPWPRGGLDEGWAATGTIQRRVNVWLVQNPSLPCMPCRREGCERHLDSYSQCLDELSVGQVLAAVEQALAVAEP